MEKDSKLENYNLACQNKDVSKKTINLINQTLKNPGEEFGDRINFIIDKIVSSIDQDSIKMESAQKKIFNEICDFLNGIFKEIHIKKFYNNIPKIDLKSYSNKNLGNQFINNIYGKERKIFYRDEINGGDCYYRTIFLKNLFDVLKEKGLNIQNRIFVYDEKWGHSSVIIKFQGEIYLADYGLFNQMFSRIISPIDTFDGYYQTEGFTKISFNRQNDFGVCYFDETKDFIKYITSKKIDSAAIEFNPRLIDGKENNIRIEFFKRNIVFKINGKTHKYYLKDGFNLSNICKNSHEVLDFVLKGLVADKQEKNELKLYFDMIRDKINPKKVYEILG